MAYIKHNTYVGSLIRIRAEIDALIYSKSIGFVSSYIENTKPPFGPHKITWFHSKEILELWKRNPIEEATFIIQHCDVYAWSFQKTYEFVICVDS